MASGLDPISDTLSPLPDSHRSGLTAVAAFGFLSFIATSTLFLYLTYKLLRWHLNPSYEPSDRRLNAATDLSLGLSQGHFSQSKAVPHPVEPHSRRKTAAPRKTLNQFLLLVYNLLFAEMQQSVAFLLNTSWATSDGIFVGTSTCWAQGWFVSVGDLAVSCFITAIAVHTYLTVIRGYRPPQWAMYVTIGSLWIFVYVLGIMGIWITNNGRAGGGLYVRAAAWCWMNVEYENLRLWLHYFWIFLCLGITSSLYGLIFFSLRRQNHSNGPLARSHTSGLTGNARVTSKAGGKHPGFLIYPLIYVLCTAPLALGRIAAMSGRHVSVTYFCLAGAMIASNGWLDVILFSWTRSSIIFAATPDSADAGLDTFTFMRTPHTRLYGNMVWVQGDTRGRNNDSGDGRRDHHGWWRLGGDRSRRTPNRGLNGWARGTNSGSQESLRGAGMNEGIQLDTVTTVVVEIDPANKEATNSVGSSEKRFG
ncbi:G protein-coupled glucose receptor regulating Gpa2-domain-containing protein [Xylariales sp. AK1849]|nr:G protein-coupled glucose receptor regulating Gpa2-domain-containing protein [Xylariales sp. AK1849]